MVNNDFPGRIGEEQEWCPLLRHNSVPRHLIVIQNTPLQGHPALTSTLQPILLVTMLGVTENFTSVIDQMTFATDFKHINLLHAENANLTHTDLNTSLDES